MRIAINALSARKGGGITYLMNLFEGFGDNKEAEFFVLTSNSIQFSDRSNVKHVKARWPTINPLTRSLWESIFLPIYLRKIKADILFCPGGTINLKAPAGCKTVTMFRNMLPFDPVQRKKYGLSFQRLRNFLLNRLMRKSMSRADMVIFLSEHVRNQIMLQINGTLTKTVVIPHGLHNRFKTADSNNIKRPEWLPECEYLLYVSIFDVYKNQLEVVRGYSKLKQFRQTEEKLVLVGEHLNRYGQRVKDEINRLDLQRSVLLPGAIPYQALPNVYKHAKLIIFASECENCPNILIEALGSGKPLLVSNRQPMPEFGRDAVKYFNPALPEDLANKIYSIIDDQVILDKLSEKVRVLAQSYDWGKTADLTLEVFKKLLRE